MARARAPGLAAAPVTVGAILLAAGGSRRFGPGNKLLADLDGRPLVTHAARAIADAGLPMIAVLGHEAEAVRAALQPFAPDFVAARAWADGMGNSIAAGIAAAPSGWTGALICLGDMPRVAAADIGAIAAAITSPGSIAAPVHEGRRGNPVGLGCAWFPALAALRGDMGAREILRGAAVAHVLCGPGILHDIDIAADLG